MYLVHQFYPKSFYGTEKFVLNMATCMQKQGHEVTVVAYAFKGDMKNSTNEGNVLTERYVYHGVPVISFGYEKASDAVYYEVYNEDLQGYAEKLLSEEKPDIIHAGHLMRVFDILKSAKERSIPYVVTLTDFWTICFRGILVTQSATYPEVQTLVQSERDLCQGPEDGEACIKNCPQLPHEVIHARLCQARDILTGAKAVCAPTRFLANIYMKEMPALDIRVIPLGLRMAKSLDRKKSLKKGDTVAFIYGGAWLPHKGLHLLLEAFSKVRQRNAVLKVYGTGPIQEYNDAVSGSAKKDKRIQIKGVFSEAEMGAILTEADCSVLPSTWWENSPYMMIEALARNVPVIVTDVGGLTEYVQDNVHGYTFRIGDSSHLQAVIERILDDPTVLNAMRENLSRYVLQTVEEEAYAYETVYRGSE